MYVVTGVQYLFYFLTFLMLVIFLYTCILNKTENATLMLLVKMADKRFLFQFLFLAHLSTTCSRGAFRVVMCPSCVVNNFFKHLLPNRWANLDQTWQECSLGGLLQKVFTEFDSIKNSGCHGNEIEFFKQFFKNLLCWSNFEIISQECSLDDLFQNLFTKF